MGLSSMREVTEEETTTGTVNLPAVNLPTSWTRGTSLAEQPASAERAYLPLQLTALAADPDGVRREYGVTFIKAGRVRRRDGKLANWTISAEAVRGAIERINGVICFVDHAMGGFFMPDNPSLRDAAGITFDARYNPETQAAEGGLRLYSRSDMVWLREFLDEIVADQAAGRETPDVGLSLVFFGQHDMQEDEDGSPYRVTTSIDHVESCDLVFGPGAEGRVREILSKAGPGPGQPNLRRLTMADELEATQQAEAQPAPAPAPAADTGLADRLAALERQVQQALPQQPAVPGENDRLARLEQQLDNVVSGMERVVDLVTRTEERRVIGEMGVGASPRMPAQVRGHWLSSLDQVERAYEQLMGLDVPGDVHRLSGIRELYLLLTGDRNFRGEFNRNLVPDFLAYSSSGNNADTTTMAELTRNVMNKALIQQLALLEEYNWWQRIAHIDDFNSLQQVSWVRYGGIGYDTGTGLPTVAEKGEYQQLLWEDDRTTADWVKKGGYLPLSLEMIDRDDLMGWRDVPRQLALAQAVTISSVVSALFTANSGAGASLGDGVGDGYAFNTTRGNLITQPLDQTNWDTAVDTMYKLTQLMHSTVSESRRIAARPRFALVPIELESQAITAVTSAVKPGTFGDRQPMKRILPEEAVITVPHWTDANDWAALADPRLVPFVGVAFRFGRNAEIFMPGENNHILWLHDVLPIKTRWFFAVSVIDWRGCIKSNN